ncbi:MAG: DUF4287 domain-containing protein [Mycobacteriales bacterium]|nr:DUF4287 domain-containing protein [Frankia sp.]
MSLNHSKEIHQSLLERIPEVTGRQLPEWFEQLDNGPALLRFDERVSWLKDHHEIPHGYAAALVYEHDRRRSNRGVAANG